MGERKKNELVVLIDNSIIVSIPEIFYKKNKKLFLSNYFKIFLCMTEKNVSTNKYTLHI